VWASGDGSLFVGTATADRSVVHTYRIRDAAAAAHSAVPLGPVAADCVSDNRVHPPTEQRRPRPYPAGPFDLPLDARGSVLRSTLHTVTVRRGPSGSFATVHRSTATIGNAAADGTGGAWWSEQRNSRFSVWHLDSRDRATAVVADRPAAGRFAGDEIAANPADGSCWWRAGSSTWLSTDRSGHTRVTHYAGRAPVFGGGAGFALGDTDGTIRRVSVAGAGPAVLGGNRAALWLPSAVTSQATPPDYSVDGSFAVTSRGELLLLQRGWLARFGSAGRVTLLAGPSDGIPADGQLSTVVGNRVVILPDNPGARAYAVGVS
jgi:hypothetical protein